MIKQTVLAIGLISCALSSVARADEGPLHRLWHSMHTQSTTAKAAGVNESAADLLKKRGHPCHKSVSDMANIGHMEIWYYDCIPGMPIGNESYTMQNGYVVDHTKV